MTRSRSTSLSLLGLVVFSALLARAAAPASAHVAPSLDDNNRYLKLSLLPDRVRLVYTVFFGEVPGAAMRHDLDKDRDGQLSDAETDAFARELGREVAAQLTVELDGQDAPVSFATVSFGSATQLVRGGSFSVDLIATLCMAPRPDGVHRVKLRDHFRVPRPGETEVQLEDGVGTTIASATIGEHRAAERVFRFAGVVPALGEPGLLVEFRIAAEAVQPAAGACEQQAKRRGGSSSPPFNGLSFAIMMAPGVGLVIGFASLAIYLALRDRRRRREGG